MTISDVLGEFDAKNRLIRLTDKAGEPMEVRGAGLPGTLRVFGSSTFFGQGASGNTRRATSRLAAITRMTETNLAVSGAVLYKPNEDGNSGGYATVLQNYAPARAAAPWVSDLGAVVVGYNHNDLGTLPATPEGLNPFKCALVTVIDRLRAAAVFEDTHASVTYSAGMVGVQASTTRNSGAGYTYTAGAAQGESATIEVPASFTGTDIIVGSVAGVLPNFRANVEWRVDGQLWPAIVRYEPFITTGRIGFTYRLQGIPPGAHTIVAKVLDNVGGGSSNWSLDYWSIEAEVPPIIVLCGAYRRLGGYTDSQMYAIGKAIEEVAGHYTDGSVVVADLDAAVAKNPAFFVGDQIHQNDLGHAMIAEAIAKALYAGAAAVDVAALV